MRNLNSMRIGSIEDIIKNNEKRNKKTGVGMQKTFKHVDCLKS